MFNGMDMYRRDKNVLDLITEAMKDERHDRVKYKKMMELAKNDKVRKQIEFAYKDEGKHYMMFKHIYYMLTGRECDIPVPKIEKIDCLLPAIESSINGELGAVELYRRIQSMLPTIQMRDMLFEIITDEQEHATRFVYLYSMLK
ncbi:ferritin-like domain-containing protein [Clostridium sp. CX1]|uniref:Ferritin-like domain-containing protein n=1 Tax=Clostridium tanneri TaxID=3037988 RepID=A0ABU4JSN8_9CLOT|nr:MULTISPECIES: ferritin-like domain-containing protein [unclassified Clostridium]MCT8976964.1 ferritin-like domain-containing protein [Clostridium sp. CX1]MDW8801172.1 ferritin-like domain-containing protein [Clostridium sp. A1-XYC3]